MKTNDENAVILLGRRIRSLRNEKGWTQQELGDQFEQVADLDLAALAHDRGLDPLVGRPVEHQLLAPQQQQHPQSKPLTPEEKKRQDEQRKRDEKPQPPQ